MLKKREQFLGPDNIETSHARGSLAYVLAKSGDVELAEAMLRRALRALVDAVGLTHPASVSARNKLAKVLQMRGKADEAEETMHVIKDCKESMSMDAWRYELNC